METVRTIRVKIYVCCALIVMLKRQPTRQKIKVMVGHTEESDTNKVKVINNLEGWPSGRRRLPGKQVRGVNLFAGSNPASSANIE